MENRKQYLERQLVANVLKDKCAHCGDVLFEESWCTQDRCIRFTLPLFRALFPPKQNCNKWVSGDFVMFEVNNNIDGLEILCVIDLDSIPKEYSNDYESLLKEFNITSGNIVWSSKCKASAPNEIFEFFDNFLTDTIPQLHKKILSTFIFPIAEEFLKEGAVRRITSTRYERNRKARELCLSYYGKTCKRCGLNFEKTYGERYSNIIEVHHIIPINEIGKSYIVDPIKDLIPLCPNCHAMVHCDIKNNCK